MKHTNAITAVRALPARADSLLVKQQRIETLGAAVGVLTDAWTLTADVSGTLKGAPAAESDAD